jgi:hypothetical protein
MSALTMSPVGETLTSFLNPNTVVRNNDDKLSVLSQLSCIATMASGGIEALFKGNLDQFDALVGENACQLRATQIYDLATRVVHDGALKSKLIEERAKVEQILKKIAELEREPAAKMKLTSLHDFVTQNELDTELSEEAALLTRCFLLTVGKKMTPKGATFKEEVDETVLTKRFSFSKGAAKNILKAAQEKLAEKSVAYLQAEAARIDECEPKLLPDLVGPSFIKLDAQKRKVAPCLFGIAVILRRAMEKGEPILLTLRLAKGEKGLEKVQEVEHLLFEPEGSEFVLSSLETADLTKPALIIEGNALYPADDPITLAEVKAKLLEEDMQTVILANAASHTQYAGCSGAMPPMEELIAKKQQQSDEDSVHFLQKGMRKIKRLIDLAEERGFCAKNPSTFCIDHIFCNRIINQLRATL